jgi:MtfA peptidase
LLDFFKRARARYILQRYAIKHGLWEQAIDRIPCLRGLGIADTVRLRELCTLLLHRKNLVGVGIMITEEMKVVVAAQACLPVLALGLDMLNGWRDIIIYPDVFRVSRDEMDEYGIVHHNERILSGEAWSRGPMIISWHDIDRDLQSDYQQGCNVIIHEIAHKLDMLNGRANGMPPLHSDMQRSCWTEAFSQAYQEMNDQLDQHHKTFINPYAANSPAEFFAVFSEYFFCAPDILKIHFAAIYTQLQLYYRQDPLSRMDLTNTRQ